MIRRPPRSTQSRSSAASDVYKRQPWNSAPNAAGTSARTRMSLSYRCMSSFTVGNLLQSGTELCLSLIHISEPTRLGMISYAVFCLKKKKKKKKTTYVNDVHK